MSKQEVVVNSIQYKLLEENLRVVNCSDGSLPDLLIVDANYGFAAIFVLMEDEIQDKSRIESYVKSRLKNLRSEFPETLLPEYRPAIVVKQSTSQKEKGFVDVSVDFLNQISPTQVPIKVLDEIYDRFNPKFNFARKKRIELDDPLRDIREKSRIVLRGEQREFVELEPREIVWITGPAGSGKSLVLMARAMSMSRENPQWAISFLTFNQSLKRYFRDELRNYSNITVETFGEFTARRNDRFHFYYGKGKEKKSVSLSQTERDYRTAFENGIARDVDAIFVDEIQDFYPSWLRYIVESQSLDGGGLTIAGDESQAIYRENDISSIVKEYDHIKVELPVSYRSTYEILTCVEHLTGKKQNLDRSPHGMKPDLIYVDTDKSKNGINDALIRDLISLLKYEGIRERDIGILVTRNYHRFKIRQELEERLAKEFKYPVPVASIERGAADLLNLEEDSIKLTTVHNAKGLEFSVVFMLGLDDLTDEGEDEPMIRKGERLVLVGPTRARDRLFIYYSKLNTYFERLSKHPESVTFRTYPDDFDLEEQ
jgi:energy-coupling factor transporter ATP-binding protein EcfA2